MSTPEKPPAGKRPGGAFYKRQRAERERDERERGQGRQPPPLPPDRPAEEGHVWAAEIVLAQLREIASDAGLPPETRWRLTAGHVAALGKLGFKTELERTVGELR